MACWGPVWRGLLSSPQFQGVRLPRVALAMPVIRSSFSWGECCLAHFHGMFPLGRVSKRIIQLYGGLGEVFLGQNTSRANKTYADCNTELDL